jgi:hypothetical protein
MDLNMAVKSLGQTLTGTTGKLGMMVPELQNMTAEQLKSGAAIDLVAEKYLGSAEASQKGLGALNQLKISLEDFVELIGKAAAPFVIFFSEQLKGLTDNAAKSEETIAGLGEAARIVAIIFSGVKNFVIGLGDAIGIGLAATVESAMLVFQGQFTKAKEVALLGYEELANIAKERAQIQADELDALDQVREQQDIDRKMREEQLLAQSNNNQLALIKKHAAEQKKVDDLAAAEKTKKEAERLKAEAAFAQTQVSIASGAANLITAVAGTQSRIAFIISKAAAIAQSIVSTKVAAANALATVPYPANLAAAANMKIAGALNTAAIVATSIQGLAEGGIVKARPGGIIANIGEGGQDEAVIPLDRMGGMMGSVTINLNGPVLGDRDQARQFAVEIDRQLLELRRSNESVAFDSSIS